VTCSLFWCLTIIGIGENVFLLSVSHWLDNAVGCSSSSVVVICLHTKTFTKLLIFGPRINKCQLIFKLSMHIEGGICTLKFFPSKLGKSCFQVRVPCLRRTLDFSWSMLNKIYHICTITQNFKYLIIMNSHLCANCTKIMQGIQGRSWVLEARSWPSQFSKFSSFSTRAFHIYNYFISFKQQ